MAEPFTDEEMEILQAEAEYESLRVQNFLATITADRKRFEETLDGYTKDWAEQKRGFQKRIEEAKRIIVELRKQLQRYVLKLDAHRDWMPVADHVKLIADQTATIERLRELLVRCNIELENSENFVGDEDCDAIRTLRELVERDLGKIARKALDAKEEKK